MEPVCEELVGGKEVNAIYEKAQNWKNVLHYALLSLYIVEQTFDIL